MKQAAIYTPAVEAVKGKFATVVIPLVPSEVQSRVVQTMYLAQSDVITPAVEAVAARDAVPATEAKLATVTLPLFDRELRELKIDTQLIGMYPITPAVQSSPAIPAVEEVKGAPASITVTMSLEEAQLLVALMGKVSEGLDDVYHPIKWAPAETPQHKYFVSDFEVRSEQSSYDRFPTIYVKKVA